MPGTLKRAAIVLVYRAAERVPLMSRRICDWVAVCALVLVAGWTWGGEPRPQAADGAPAAGAAEGDLDVRYAQARLALAEANLKRMEGMNAEVPHAVSANVIMAYRNDVALARLKVDAAQAGQGEMLQVWLKELDTQRLAAEAGWRSAVAANKEQPGTVNSQDVERLRLRAAMLAVNLERGRALEGQPREAQIAWRLSMLDDEIERLSEEVFRTNPPRGNRASIWYYWVPW